MHECLIFPTKVEQQATLELIKQAFPTAKLWQVPSDDENIFVNEMELDLEKEVFFEWAILPDHSGRSVILYCLNLTLELLEQKPWITNVYLKMKFADGKNLLGE